MSGGSAERRVAGSGERRAERVKAGATRVSSCRARNGASEAAESRARGGVVLAHSTRSLTIFAIAIHNNLVSSVCGGVPSVSSLP